MLKRIRNIFGRRAGRPAGEEKSNLPNDETPEPVSTRDAAPVKAAAAIHHGPQVVHHPIPVDDLDPDAVKIVRRLTRFDHSAYLVGGCVRDLLLGRTPKDFDVATSATPRQVKRMFGNCRIIGRRFRLAHIFFQSGKIIEVATYRAGSDGDGDGDGEEAPTSADLMIRDDNVFGSPEQDALRRDFTINALFYDVNQENVLDHARGLDDLRTKLVRTIGDPAIRFREDPIRILRAIKFAARLDFRIEPGTLDALRALRHEIPKAATARILEEINRFCRSGAARASFELLRETDVLVVVLPEVAEALCADERAWRLALTLLDEIDAVREQGREATTGVILAALVFPLLAPRMGWESDGRVAPGIQFNIREAADVYLGPMAPRLRVSRRDQEECRQILLLFQRMVPARGLKRGVREALRRRPSFGSAVRLLEAATRVYAGDVAEAASYWRGVSSAEPLQHRPSPEGEPVEVPDDKRRRRRRRGGRSRRGESETRPPAQAPAAVARAAAVVQAPAAQRGNPDLPPPWDDRYFFAALPTASSEAGVAQPGDRYGAAVASPAVAAHEIPARESGDAPGVRPAAPKPRRRRRRSGRGGAEKAAAGEGAGPSRDGDPEA